MLPSLQEKYFNKLLQYFAFALILLGIVVRIVVLIHNRDLIIDEANIARNVFERGFVDLAKPLSYEQYAPPVFMWVLKIMTAFFGFSELGLRLYPLLSGVCLLVMMYLLIKEFTSIKTAWYPVGMLVVSYTMIRYSTEVKQYMCDALIVLSLIYLAIKIEMGSFSKTRFFFIWFIIGSIAIWSSMPSVFLLSGIGAFYFFKAIGEKNWKNAGVIVGVSFAWLLQFAFYYFTILKPQIDSNYLQNYHQEYFLFATPSNKGEWIHNFTVVNDLIKHAVGFNHYVNVINIILIFSGAVLFFLRSKAKSLLILVPIVLTLIAAALNQFSLIPRVAIFIMPLFLVLACIGLEELMKLKWVALKLGTLVMGTAFIYYLSDIKQQLTEKTESEKMSKAMNYLMDSTQYLAPQIFIHNGARPAFIYYSQIHPDQNKWARIREAHLLSWDANYDSIAVHQDSNMVLVLTNAYEEDLKKTRATIEKYKTGTTKIDEYGCHVFLYR